MFQMVYSSRETEAFSSEHLITLLRWSRTKNERLGITGMLLHADGEFLQVLEGDEEPVRALFARIARDSRHTGTVVVREAFLERRDFPDWSMGFRNLDTASQTDLVGVNRFLQSNISARNFVGAPPGAKALLLAFKARCERADVRSPASVAPMA